jgi:hypothetical protein
MKKDYKKPEMDVVFANVSHLMAPSKVNGGKAGDGNDDDYGGIGGEGTGEGDLNARRNTSMWDEWDEE